MRDTMGAMSGMTGGYTNSAAVTAGGQQRQYWADKLMDRIPELQNNAYQRYLGEFDMNNSALGAVQGVDTQQFNREYGANNDLRNDILDSIDRRIDREDKAYDRSVADRDWNQYLREYADSQGWKQKEFDENIKTNELNREAMALANEQTKRVDILWQAQNSGTWPAGAENYGFDTNQNPFYYDLQQEEIKLDSYRKQLDYSTEKEKEMAAYNMDLEKSMLDYEYLARQRYGNSSGGGSGGSGGSSKKSSGGSSSTSGKTTVSNSDVNSWAKYFEDSFEADGYLSPLEKTSPNTYKPINGSSEKIAMTILSNDSMTDAQKADLLSKLGISDQTIETVLSDKHYMGR